MRSKEEAHDCRYFPDPDLPPLVVSPEWLEEVRRSLPELPAERRRRLRAEYSLSDYDAGVVTASRELADHFEEAARASGHAKAAANWVGNHVLRRLNEGASTLAACPIGPQALAALIRLVESGEVNATTGRHVFEAMWTTGEPAEAIVEREGLRQVSDGAALAEAVAAVLEACPDQVAACRGGKTAALGWLVGQVMKRTGGKANPRLARDLLEKALAGP
jgi:aspartyl-tRNA(Asn)/glutamyl-tRNA(Gln) amidotransferase subunit B